MLSFSLSYTRYDAARGFSALHQLCRIARLISLVFTEDTGRYLLKIVRNCGRWVSAKDQSFLASQRFVQNNSIWVFSSTN